jgi:hypothetical protein
MLKIFIEFQKRWCKVEEKYRTSWEVRSFNFRALSAGLAVGLGHYLAACCKIRLYRPVSATTLLLKLAW